MTKSYVSVQFQEDKYDKNNFNSRHYDYLSLDDSLEAGDLVVVETKFGHISFRRLTFQPLKKKRKRSKDVKRLKKN